MNDTACMEQKKTNCPGFYQKKTTDKNNFWYHVIITKQFQVKVAVIMAEGLHNSLSYLHDSHISTDWNYSKNDEAPTKATFRDIIYGAWYYEVS